MRILIAIDTDKNIDHLSSRFSKILNLFDEELFYVDILHIYRKPEADAPHLPVTMKEIQDGEQKIKIKFLHDCTEIVDNMLTDELHKSALVNSYLYEGKFFSMFKDHIKRHPYDLIVLLPGQKDNLELLLKGRNITKVISKVDIPILILPKVAHLKYRSTCFIGMLENCKKDYKYFKDIDVIQKIKDKHLRYIHIGKAPKKEINHLEVIEEADKVVGFDIYHKKSRKNNIYVMNHKPRKGLKKWFKGSFTKNLLSNHETMLMVI